MENMETQEETFHNKKNNQTEPLITYFKFTFKIE